MDYEKMRQKVKKQYKAQLDELSLENLRLKEKIVNLEKENKRLKRELLAPRKQSGFFTK